MDKKGKPPQWRCSCGQFHYGSEICNVCGQALEEEDKGEYIEVLERLLEDMRALNRKAGDIVQKLRGI